MATRLQASGIAAYPVLQIHDLASDAQLAARDFWRLLPQARYERDLVTGYPIHLEETPAHVGHAGPALGEHNQYILGELLGYPTETIDELTDGGIVHPFAFPAVRLSRSYWQAISERMPTLDWPHAVAEAE